MEKVKEYEAFVNYTQENKWKPSGCSMHWRTFGRGGTGTITSPIICGRRYQSMYNHFFMA